jgi:hypothetical protein
MLNVLSFEFDADILPIRQCSGDQSAANACERIDYNIAAM